MRPLMFVAVTGQGGVNCGQGESSVKSLCKGFPQSAGVCLYTVAMMHYQLQEEKVLFCCDGKLPALVFIKGSHCSIDLFIVRSVI